MTAVHDMDMVRGNTFRRRFRLKGLDGNALDLRGSVLSLTIGDGGRPIRRTTADASLTIVSAVAGEIELHLTASDTRDLPVGVVPYELERSILDQRSNEWDEATILAGLIVVQRGFNDER